MAEETRISKDIDRKIYELARNLYKDGKKRQAESIPELKTMISGTLDDGSPASVLVKIRANPINPRLSAGWKVTVEGNVWEIPVEEMEKSSLL
jgi:hypothetical protein